jgi:SP family facilitated glucose transporter-like MFS transporter 1
MSACDTSVTFIWSFVVAIFCIGGMMGGSVVGLVSSRLGRKGGLLLNNILVVISALLMGAAKAAGSYHMLILGRLIIGINAGLNAGLAPMYLAEISPTALRGAVRRGQLEPALTFPPQLGTVYQLIITMSILLSQARLPSALWDGRLTSTLPHAGPWHGQSPWHGGGLVSSQLHAFAPCGVLQPPVPRPWLLALTAVPALFQLATLPFCPESPKYLLLDKDDEHGAEEGL